MLFDEVTLLGYSSTKLLPRYYAFQIVDLLWNGKQWNILEFITSQHQSSERTKARQIN